MDDLSSFFSEEPTVVNQLQENTTSYSNKGSYGQSQYPKRKFFPKKEIDLDTFQLYKPISIIVNPDVPEDIIKRLIQLKDVLVDNKFNIRLTSGTKGDEALIAATKDIQPEIYLPWKDFNNIESKLYFNDKLSQHIAKQFHRSYDTLKPAIQAFLARNVRLVLGEKLKAYTLGVITWSEDGAEDITEVTFKTGNISHVISIAKALHIPVFNLQKPDAIKRLISHFKLKQPVPNQTGGNSV